jgi:hypothetical protein
MHAEANTYSHRWFDFFHVNISEARTMQEAAFVCRCAPLPGFRKIADVCCGMGRHAGRSRSMVTLRSDLIATLM